MAEYKSVTVSGDQGGAIDTVTKQDVINEPIDWASYVSLGISQRDAKILLSAQKTAQMSDLDFSDPTAPYHTAPKTVAETLIKCAKNITQQGPPRQYLTLTECFVEGHADEFVPHFVGEDGNLTLAPFLRYVDNEDEYVSSKAAMVCAYLVSVKGQPVAEEHSKTLMLNMVTRMTRGGNVLKDTLPALMVMLRNPENRVHFVQHPRAGQVLISLVSDKTPRQQLYETLFALWAVSYCEECYEVFAREGLVKKLVEVTLTSASDKIVRMGISTLRNLLGKEYQDTSFNEDMIDVNILKTLGELSARPWNHEWDREDVEEDLKVLVEELQKNFRVMSSFERYKMELHSGKLQKGPVHSEKFWGENAYRFEWKEFKLIKGLVKLLESPEPQTLAIACYDIGEFARFYSQGKMVVRNLGGKNRVMELMTHEDKEVAKQALQSSAKLLISNWEHVTS